MKSTLLSAVVLGLTLTACARLAPVRNPPPVSTSDNDEVTEAAVYDALRSRRWVVQERTPGRLTVMYSARSHRLWAHVHWNGQQVWVTFLNSENLSQSRRGNEVVAHGRVNVWLNNLANDIAIRLQQPGATPGQNLPLPPQDGAPAGDPPPPAYDEPPPPNLR